MSAGLAEAQSLFHVEHPGRSWRAWVSFYQTPPRLFVYDGTNILFASPQPSNGSGPPDTWVIWYAAGSITALFDHAPYPLPYLCWQRRKTQSLHFHSWVRIRSLVFHHGRL